jgi:spore coat-associated protein N
MGLNLKSTSSKVLASAALLAAAAGVAGMGTYGGFTASTSASAAVDSATVSLTGADNNLSIPATKIIPGDTIQRTFKLVNGGNLDLAGITLTTSTASPSLLTTDATNGLQLQIDKCPAAWSVTETGAYTCNSPGTVAQGTAVLAKRAVIGESIALPGLAAATANASDNLRITLTLPTTAGNEFQGKSSTINFAFNAATRAAASK